MRFLKQIYNWTLSNSNSNSNSNSDFKSEMETMNNNEIELQTKGHLRFKNRTIKLGWKRDNPDFRDYRYTHYINKILPSKVDLRDKMPKIYDQGQLGSCTANAIAGAIQYDEMKEELKSTLPSRLFIYYNERAMEGSVDYDAGATIRDGIKVVHKIGYCDESMWPYNISNFTLKPSNDCYKYADNHKAIEYSRVYQNITDIKNSLNNGFPIVFGISVYSSFESDNVSETGKIPMPKKDEYLLGGHAILAVGYNDTEQHIIFRNSWGEEWGDNGYGYLPYEYICNTGLASDFWIIKTIS
jgi:C1A family cysteine protease